ncbi:hypothetical protein AAG570_013596 [Ranatra chinensis]|uniref:Uncharacterized protein n=1 Tax=Ranatra chinensis TaxID=642074 RepID=A0ABD0YEI9_9HEMI
MFYQNKKQETTEIGHHCETYSYGRCAPNYMFPTFIRLPKNCARFPNSVEMGVGVSGREFCGFDHSYRKWTLLQAEGCDGGRERMQVVVWSTLKVWVAALGAVALVTGAGLCALRGGPGPGPAVGRLVERAAGSVGRLEGRAERLGRQMALVKETAAQLLYRRRAARTPATLFLQPPPVPCCPQIGSSNSSYTP